MNFLFVLPGTIFPIILLIIAAIQFVRRRGLNLRPKSSDGKATNTTPVSLLEIKVELPAKVIFQDESAAAKCNPSELVQLQKTRLGEGIMGTLFKAVLDCGSIITIRKIRDGLVKPGDGVDLEFWIKFFGGMRDPWLLPMQFSFWYGGEAFVLYEYLCLGSLEDLLHGSEGIQFTPLSWEVRKKIAVCAAMALASIHTRVTASGDTLVCGVIKASNVLIRTDFSACLSGYEIPHLVPEATIIRRNRGRIAPELKHNQNCSKTFTHKSDVYSFGILLLELITAKRPTVTNLRQCAMEKKRREGSKGICDRKMGELKYGMIEMIEISLCCLQHNPQDRPSMDSVVQMLQGLKD